MIDFILQNYSHIIVNTLIQVTMILIIFLIMSITIYKNKHVAKYNFLLFGLLLIILCPIISNQLNLFQLNIPIEIKSIETPSTPVLTPVSNNEISLTTNKTQDSKENAKIDSDQNDFTKEKTAIFQKKIIISETNTSINKSFPLTKFAFILWLIGFLFFTIKTYFGFKQVKQLILKSTPLLDREILKIVGEAIKSLKINSQPQLLISNISGSPFVTGLINPKIVIPQILIENYDEDSLKSILLHELAHIKRKDVAKGFLQIFLQNIFWFHPLIYLYNKEMNFSREEICDNYSLTHHQPKCYASILAQLAEAQINKNNFNGVNSMISSKNELFNRVKNILNPNRSIATSMTSSDLLSLVLILMISLFTIGSFRLVKAEEATKQETNTELSNDLLDQKVSINFTKAFTLQEFINLLNKSNNLKISIHESLSKLSETQKQRSFLIAKDMALKDVLTWINLTLGIDYAVINNKIVFCSPNLKDTIDTNYYLESFSLENLLAIENKDLKKEKDDFSNQLNLNDIKELIIDGISRDTWDDAKGRSIEIFSNKLLVKHNKATLKKIKQWLTELEYSIKEANDPNFIPTFNKPETLIEKSIQTSLKKIVSYKFQSKQFKEILEEISKSNNISFSLILDSIESFEKLNHEKISFEIKGQPLDKVLNDLLAKYSLDYQILNGTFFISSDSFFEKRLTLERYNTKIICQKESITSDVLKDLILNNLNKSSWDYDEKGTSIFAAGGQLLVTQNKKTHELISEFLKGLMSGKVNIKLSDKPK